jgi:uncharacterized protein
MSKVKIEKYKKSFYSVFSPIGTDEYLLVNTYTGAVDVIDLDVKELLETIQDIDKREIEENMELLSYLEERGHILSLCKKEEISSLESLFADTFNSQVKKRSYAIVLTYDCNLRCIYCFEKDVWKKKKTWVKKVLGKNEIDKIFKSIKEIDKLFQNKYNLPIELTGGEPLLLRNRENIMYTLEKGQKEGYKFIITTNGVTLNEYINLIKNYDPICIRVTLDGIKEIHDKRRINPHGEGSFDQIIEGIKLARENGIPLYIKTNVDTGNINEVPDFVEFIRSEGWADDPEITYGIALVKEYDNIPNIIKNRKYMINKITELFKKHPEVRILYFSIPGGEFFEKIFEGNYFIPKFYGCTSLVSQFIFDPHGSIYPCMLGLSGNIWRVGKYIPELSFEESKIKSLRNRNIFNMQKCKKCTFALLCGGGCAYDAYRIRGTYQQSFCPPFNEVFSSWLPYFYHKIKCDISEEEVTHGHI